MDDLNEYNFLHDAIVFRKQLNPAIWADNDMKPEVRQTLLDMAEEFKSFLGLDDLNILDITVSGSNAAYTYTNHSDIDLHLVVRIPKEQGQLYLELFDAKKNLYNMTHDQRIKGYEVEFYVQDVNNPVKSIGIYSVLKGKWLSVPKRVRTQVDDLSVLSKVDAFTNKIMAVLNDTNIELAQQIWAELKEMRKNGLEAEGEFSPENLAFKILRTRGLNQKLFDHILSLKDKELSLESLSEQQLNELFNSNVDMVVLANRRSYFKSEAEINNRIIRFEAQLEQDGSWHIVFSELSGGQVRYDATGGGGENQVFAMVIASLRKFIDSYQPDLMYFTADKAGDGNSVRGNIYHRLVSRYFSTQYQVTKRESTAVQVFKLTKK